MLGLRGNGRSDQPIRIRTLLFAKCRSSDVSTSVYTISRLWNAETTVECVRLVYGVYSTIGKMQNFHLVGIPNFDGEIFVYMSFVLRTLLY